MALTIEAAKADRDRLLREYADQMDHMAKYARAECNEVRGGVAPDSLAGALLERLLATYRAWARADKNLYEVRRLAMPESRPESTPQGGSDGR